MNTKKRLLKIALHLRWIRKDDYEAKVTVEVTDTCYEFVSIKLGLPNGIVGLQEMQYIVVEFSHEGEECIPKPSEVTKGISGLHSSGHPLGVTALVLVNGEIVGSAHQDFPRLERLGVSLPLTVDWKSAAECVPAPLPKSRTAACKDFDLIKIKSWPESKIVKERQCVGPPWARVCTDVPVVYLRNCELHITARICHPELDAIIHDVEDCLRRAVIAGVIAALVTQNPAAGSAALEAFLKACLESKAVKRASEIRVEVHPQSSSCGEWKRKT